MVRRRSERGRQSLLFYYERSGPIVILIRHRAKRGAGEDLLLCHAVSTDEAERRESRSSARYARIRMTTYFCCCDVTFGVCFSIFITSSIATLSSRSIPLA